MTEYASIDQLLAGAATDRTEEDVTEVFGGLTVRVRSLSAHQQARVKQASMNLGGRNPTIAWAEMERLQFQYGVVKPELSADDVKRLHLEAGPSFAKVIAKIDEISGLNKEDLRKAQEEFPEPAGDGE